MISTGLLRVSEEVSEAIAGGRPVVALETTIVTHGLPAPHNLETARDCERIVRGGGCVPATVGILEGRIVVGLSEEEIVRLAGATDVAKTNLSNIGAVVAAGTPGATSVSTTLLAARSVGIGVTVTGGIGGVHRGYARHLDVSSDLVAMERYRQILICCGAKSILDVEATREQLETRGIPVVGWLTDRFPLFYSKGRNLSVDATAQNAEDVVRIHQAHGEMGMMSSTLVVADPPAEDALPEDRLEEIVTGALAEAQARGVTGRGVTPFLLDRVSAMTGGDSLRANLSLIRNNCRIGAAIAAAFAATPGSS